MPEGNNNFQGYYHDHTHPFVKQFCISKHADWVMYLKELSHHKLHNLKQIEVKIDSDYLRFKVQDKGTSMLPTCGLETEI